MNTTRLENQESPVRSPMRRVLERAIMAVSTTTAAALSVAGCTTYVHPVSYGSSIPTASAKPNTAPQGAAAGSTNQNCEMPVKLETIANAPFTGREGVASDIAGLTQGGMKSYTSTPYLQKAKTGETVHGASTDLQAQKKAVHGGNVLINCQSLPAGSVHTETIVHSMKQGSADRGAFGNFMIPGQKDANGVDKIMAEAAGLATKQGVSSADAPFIVAEHMRSKYGALATQRAGTPGYHNGENTTNGGVNCQVVNLDCQQ